MANYKKWQPNELEFIQANQNSLNDEALALKLSEISGQTVTRSMVRRQRRKLSIKKARGRPRKVAVVSQQTSTHETT
jgi:hypothetical protein